MGVGCLVKRFTGKKVGTQSSQSKLIKKRVLFMEIVSNVEPRKNVTWEWEDKTDPVVCSCSPSQPASSV